ncbi:hypothetical protein ACQUJT_04110 [Ralstonia pseudosolanacearum]
MVVVLVLVGFGCKERVPEENTPAFNKLHGVINDGKRVNEITLINDRNNNRPRLRFPPDVPVSVYTPETHEPNPKIIRKGFAYEATVVLELSAEKKLKAIVRTPDHLVYDTVEIRFISSLGPDSPQAVEARLKEISRESFQTIDRAEWGLKEYQPTIAGDLAGYEYVPFDEEFKSIDGGRMWIGCHVGGAKLTNNQGPAGCAGHFNYRNGLNVTYLFNSSILPYWRQIYGEVVRISDSFVVE